MDTHSRYYLPPLDGLRFLAFLMVFFSHSALQLTNATLQSLRFFTALGVDFFFVIGSFIFAKLLYAEWQAAGYIDLRRFYLRRMLRIMPLYYAYLAFIAITLGGSVEWNQNNVIHGVGLVTFTDNLLFAWLGIDPLPYVAHLWTLSWEMQLYLVLPGIFYVLVRLSPYQRLIVCGLLAAIAMVLRYPVLDLHYNHIFLFLIRRPDAVLIGMFLAFATESSQGFSRRWVHAGWLLWFCALGFAAVMISQGPIVRTGGDVRMLYVTPVFSVVFGGILMLALRPGTLFEKVSGSAMMRYLGKISYGLYVYHMWCFMAGRRLVWHVGLNKNTVLNSSGELLFILSLALTILIASLSYQFIERPFLKLKERHALIPSRPV